MPPPQSQSAELPEGSVPVQSLSLVCLVQVEHQRRGDPQSCPLSYVSAGSFPNTPSPALLEARGAGHSRARGASADGRLGGPAAPGTASVPDAWATPRERLVETAGLSPWVKTSRWASWLRRITTRRAPLGLRGTRWETVLTCGLWPALPEFTSQQPRCCCGEGAAAELQGTRSLGREPENPSAGYKSGPQIVSGSKRKQQTFTACLLEPSRSRAAPPPGAKMAPIPESSHPPAPPSSFKTFPYNPVKSMRAKEARV